MSGRGQQVIASLRKMIVDGELVPGERLAEIPIAEQLGVSRMPVRLAFRALEQEGLLQKAGKRGYQVREFTEQEIRDAIDVRGVLEGLAARLVAEQRLAQPFLGRMQASLATGDRIFEKGFVTEEDVETYHQLNGAFHEALVAASGNLAIAEALARNDHLPFASSNSIAFDRTALDKEFLRLNFAHMQHHVVFDAIMQGQSARAEAVMREHANAGMHYVELFAGEVEPAEHVRLLTGTGGRR